MFILPFLTVILVLKIVHDKGRVSLNASCSHSAQIVRVTEPDLLAMYDLYI